MQPIHARVAYIPLENAGGAVIPSVRVRCCKCGHVAEAFGEQDASINFALEKLNKTCPNNEDNFYQATEGGDQTYPQQIELF